MKLICGNCERALGECFAEPCTQTYPIADGRDIEVLFVVAVLKDGSRALCEGGVYATKPQGEYAHHTLARAYEDAAEDAKRYGGAYEVVATLDGVDASDINVRSSLEPWQLARLPDTRDAGDGITIRDAGSRTYCQDALMTVDGVNVTVSWLQGYPGNTLAQKAHAIQIARVVNASTDTLAALKALRAEVEEMAQRAGWVGRGARGMADAAIAKAEGRA